MKRYLIAHVDFYEVSLTLEEVEAENLCEALLNHSKIKKDEEAVKFITDAQPDKLDDVQPYLIAFDMAVNVVEIEGTCQLKKQ